MVDTKQVALEKLRSSLLQHVPNSPSPVFRHRIAWYNSYEELFNEHAEADSEVNTLAEGALATGRVILSGRGGGAKSEVLRRLARSRLAQGDVVSLVDLKQWSRANVELWETLQGPPERIDFLLSELGSPGLSVRRLSAIPPETSRLILVDGLNEVSALTGLQILTSLEQFVRYTQNMGVIVADRLVRRSFPDISRWRLASVLPLDEDQIRELLRDRFGKSDRYDQADAGTRGMFSNPYFLSALLSSGSTATTTAEIIRELFVTHATLNNDELSRAAHAAFDAYRDSASRTFPVASFTSAAGDDVTDKLRHAGLLMVQGPLASFDHHLSHDFLAAVYIAPNEGRWESSTFDTITFGASSFDSLALAVQQIAETARADTFVRRVYDWNIYGAAYALTEGRPLNAQRALVSAEMETAVLAMMAIRQWDLIRSTQTRARDALSLFPADVAKRYLDATGDAAVFAAVDQFSSVLPRPQPWFAQWKTIFTGRHIDTSDALSKFQEDDIVGWTFANAVRRAPLDQALRASLYSILEESANSTVRWRIVHALGSDATPETAAVLIKTLSTDGDNWVRYGAIRALIEVAARGDANLRDFVAEWIRSNASVLREQARVVGELKAALGIDPKVSPEDWLRSVIGIVGAFYELEPSLEVRQDWERLAYELQRLYGRQPAE